MLPMTSRACQTTFPLVFLIIISVFFIGILPGGGLLLYEYLVHEEQETSEFVSEGFDL